MIKTICLLSGVVLAMLVVTPFGLAGLILSFAGLRKPMSFFIYGIAMGWARLMIKLIGCKVSAEGRENIPRKGGVCFVSNHGSIFDILMLLAYAGRPFGFVAKKELLMVPLLNMWIAVLGGLFIDRKNPRNALKTINKGIGRIKKGGAMVIFPEGSRSRGQGLLPFHPGSLKLATQSASVIVPVALKGTWEIFEKNNRITVGPVKITFCKPINTVDIPAADRKQILADKVFGIISEALTENSHKEN
jgi:1-acyl-sn-glycerol-3-phosphate acyltransferase